MPLRFWGNYSNLVVTLWCHELVARKRSDTVGVIEGLFIRLHGELAFDPADCYLC